jgi:hypothetical protein
MNRVHFDADFEERYNAILETWEFLSGHWERQLVAERQQESQRLLHEQRLQQLQQHQVQQLQEQQLQEQQLQE